MCGIIGIISFSKNNIINDLYESLYHLQHRGQDAFGFSYTEKNKIRTLKQNSLLSNFSNNSV